MCDSEHTTLTMFDGEHMALRGWFYPCREYLARN